MFQGTLDLLSEIKKGINGPCKVGIFSEDCDGCSIRVYWKEGYYQKAYTRKELELTNLDDKDMVRLYCADANRCFRDHQKGVANVESS